MIDRHAVQRLKRLKKGAAFRRKPHRWGLGSMPAPSAVYRVLDHGGNLLRVIRFPLTSRATVQGMISSRCCQLRRVR
jgi:hypothetical protein